MTFCPNCGTQAGTGTFCPNCGSSVASGPSSGAASSQAGTSVPPQYAPAQSLSASGMGDNVAGALCYLGTIVTGVIFLVLAPYNQSKFVRFHAFQAIFLGVAWIVVEIVAGIILHGFVLFAGPLIGLAFLVGWLYLMYTAFNNQKVKLPIIGDLAEKQA